jgi:transcription elongation factor GreA
LTDDQHLSISEAITRFVEHLKDGKQVMQGQQELLRFQARIGKDKSMATLHAIEVGEYAKWTTENVEDAATRLDPVKKFLTFANKRGWTEISLARYAAAPRRNRRRFAGGQSGSRGAGTPSARLSQERHIELQAELQRLREEVPQVREAIRLARSDGDIRENSPLDAAREQQMVERRIRQLENDLVNVEIVDAANADTERVSIGSRVTLHDIASEQSRVFTLVDVREADVSAGKISTVSPIGQALMGRSAGEEVTITTPRGAMEYRIEGIGG